MNINFSSLVIECPSGTYLSQTLNGQNYCKGKIYYVCQEYSYTQIISERPKPKLNRNKKFAKIRGISHCFPKNFCIV